MVTEEFKLATPKIMSRELKLHKYVPYISHQLLQPSPKTVNRMGTKIQAILLNDVADILQQSLQKDKTYLISTILVNQVNPQFDSAHKRFELTFSSGTQVKELETNIDIAQLRLQFVSFKDLKHHIEHNDIIVRSWMYTVHMKKAFEDI
ncbi:hypothetical protein RJ639_040486 [Escallonia herrerae]|uniref:Uncharacterized protein n=1 Tax=Escallonia herrerae TaxID=1293975 RepID=A0AA88WGC1_9ASTE|nr:hypothetical protein RJ639_040486 [Escallonia herrerae]